MARALALLVMVSFIGCVIVKRIVSLKYLTMLVYLSGVVVFISHVSCTCVDTISLGFGISFVMVVSIVIEVIEKGVVLGVDRFWSFDSIFILMLVA
jgi:hypothetical protein